MTNTRPELSLRIGSKKKPQIFHNLNIVMEGGHICIFNFLLSFFETEILFLQDENNSFFEPLKLHVIIISFIKRAFTRLDHRLYSIQEYFSSQMFHNVYYIQYVNLCGVKRCVKGLYCLRL